MRCRCLPSREQVEDGEAAKAKAERAAEVAEAKAQRASNAAGECHDFIRILLLCVTVPN